MALIDIYKDFVVSTNIASIKANRGVFEVADPRKVSYGNITTILRNNGLNLLEESQDVYLFLPSWPEWKDFADRYLTKLLPLVTYISEARDCDNLAELVRVMANIFMKVNCVGKIHCKVIVNGQTIGHFCNIVITKDNEVYLYDFNNGGRYAKFSGNGMMMGDWKYFDFDRVLLG